MHWKVRLMARQDMLSNVKVIFLDADNYEQAKSMVNVEKNQVATFEVLEEELNGTVVNDRQDRKSSRNP
jgi:hypothetical protein